MTQLHPAIVGMTKLIRLDNSIRNLSSRNPDFPSPWDNFKEKISPSYEYWLKEVIKLRQRNHQMIGSEGWLRYLQETNVYTSVFKLFEHYQEEFSALERLETARKEFISKNNLVEGSDPFSDQIFFTLQLIEQYRVLARTGLNFFYAFYDILHKGGARPTLDEIRAVWLCISEGNCGCVSESNDPQPIPPSPEQPLSNPSPLILDFNKNGVIDTTDLSADVYFDHDGTPDDV